MEFFFGMLLVPQTGQQNGVEGGGEDEENRKLRTNLAFICEIGREGMPLDNLNKFVDSCRGQLPPRGLRLTRLTGVVLPAV